MFETPEKQLCLQQQWKQSFLTLPKENQSPLGLYRNPPTFLFTNSRFMLLICNWCFVLLATNHRCVHYTHVLHHPPEWIPPMAVSRSERKIFILFLNMYIVPTKIHWFATGGFCSPPEPCEARFNLEGCALFDYFWTVEQKFQPMPL